jgi:hypothetical protein
MLLFFAAIVGPILVFLLTWVVATVYRLYFPEEVASFDKDPVMLRERARQEGRALPVGVREIRADQRRQRRLERAHNRAYHYAWGGSDGFPESWRENLWQRRN